MTGGDAGRRVGCAAGLVSAAVLAVVVFGALGVALPAQGEVAVPRIIWVVLQAIEALPEALEGPALGLFSLVVGLGGGLVVFAGIARLSGRPL
jgi:hypothetical protein